MSFQSIPAWPLLAIVAVLSFPSRTAACNSTTCSCAKVVIEHCRQGNWWIATSANFQVCSLRSIEEAASAARRCEAVRASLNKVWQLSADDAPWRPKCQVILYPDARSYVAAVGRGSEVTVGSSLVTPRAGTIISRRIDLRTDIADYLDAALPHEMCHVLVADRFRDRPAPLWYDEGLALLVDPPDKLRRHERDLRNGLRQGSAFQITEMLAAERYPEAKRLGVFYGQCAALTQLLLDEGKPARIHELAAQISDVGVNPALRATYGIAGVPELERKWARYDYSFSRQSVASLLPTITSGERLGFAAVE